MIDVMKNEIIKKEKIIKKLINDVKNLYFRYNFIRKL